ncbi:MAG: hypothetical protein ABR905_01945 [Terracidiphilus sp.]
MQELAFEISAAMDAIASNKLSKLQECIARQEVLCAELCTTATIASDGLRSPEASSRAGLDPAIQQKLQAAGNAIRELNLQYASLLRHSGRSIALLSLLCNCQAGRFQEDRGARLKRQTWSCEM